MSPGWIPADWPAPPGVHAGCTTRQGGISQGPYAGLNLGAHVDDDPAAVAANRDALCTALALPEAPRWLTQVHGTACVVALPDDGRVIIDAVSACIREKSVVVDEIHVERGRLDEVFRRITTVA